VFPLDKREAGSDEGVRARGIGREILAAHAPEIRAALARGDELYKIGDWRDDRGELHKFERFIGSKTGVHCREGDDGEPVYTRSDDYGEWVPWSIKVKFDPRPKRQPGRGPRGELRCWRHLPWESLPYKKALGEQGEPSPEGVLLARVGDIMDEQPDGSLAGGPN
jgi:hypothetical protein